MTAEKPDTLLAVVCTALHIADNVMQENQSAYREALERGQVLPKTFLRCHHSVDLLYENVKYEVLVTKKAPLAFVIKLNE